MNIEWVNHASLIVKHDGVRLITDPWLQGTAFDNGWALLCDAEFKPEDFAGITHIWISHEHPDHFSPATLRSIPPEIRRKLTVLFQQTEDRKVVEFCRELAFGTVFELRPGEWFSLTDGVRVMCRPFPEDDSWLAVEAGDQLLLNINDCAVQRIGQAEEIRGRIGRPVDVLLTQFSYASWVGNRGDHEAHHRVAESLFHRISIQCDVLKPRYVVPFASFVWFCHEDNWYLNEAMNTVGDTYAHIAEATDATPVVLYPGEKWRVGDPHDSQASIARYEPHYARVRQAEGLVNRQMVGLKVLGEMAASYSTRLRERHGRVTLRLLEATGMLKPAHIYLTDHNRAVAYSVRGGLRGSRRERERCDVELASDALMYCFLHLWGGNTLLVNGRFQAPPDGDFARFRRYLVLGDFANHGKHISHYLRPLADRVTNKVASRARALAPMRVRTAGAAADKSPLS